MLSALRTDNSPFNEQQLKLLQSSIGGLDPAQSQWLSGYLAGSLKQAVPSTLLPHTKTAPALTILYGSETGNGEAIAKALAAGTEREGVSVKLQSLDNFRPANLRKLGHAVLVISTHGEGDPPEEAVDLFAYLDSERAPQLPDLNFRVLALGDRSYSLFCEAGRRLDQRLRALGAIAFGDLVECDVDYRATADAWSTEVTTYARQNLVKEDSAEQISNSAATYLSVVPDQPRWSRQTPFKAEVGKVQQITGSGSGKEVFHLELSLEDSGLQYQPGDALGVWAPNDPELVDQILEQLDIKASETVVLNDEELTISKALTERLEITRLTADTVRDFAAAGSNEELAIRFAGLDTDQQRKFIEQRQLADLADEHPTRVGAQTLTDLLRPLSPRSYSIASSQQTVDEEVHLTVADFHSNAIGIGRQGVASGYLNQRLVSGDQVRVFLESNRRFRLPQDGHEGRQAPIIMIAAGTGIAPYRAFMQQLESETDSQGTGRDSWLIFGNPHLRTDFLYQKEWLRWRKSGLLSRIDTAWSRDQAEKHYVQAVVREQAGRLERWLQRGAHIYLCGSLPMGQAVQQALESVFAEQRGLEPAAAISAIADLRRAGRLHKEIY